MLRGKDAVLLSVLLVVAGASFWPNRIVAASFADGWDYALPAIHLLEGRGLVHLANGSKFPPVHPIGLSLLLVPSYLLLGHDPSAGIYSVFVLALMSVALVYLIAARQFGRRVGFVAAVLLAVAPTYRLMSVTIMSDACSATFWLATYALLLSALDNPRPWKWLALGHLVGYATLVRCDSLLILLPMAGVVLAHKGGQGKTAVNALLFMSGLVCWGLVCLAANYLYTGEFFHNYFEVYGLGMFNVPGWCFSWRNLVAPLRTSNVGTMLRDALQQWSLESYETNLARKKIIYAVLDVPFVIGFARLLFLARTDPRVRSFLIWLLVGLLAFVGFYGAYWWAFEQRYLQRLVPWVFIIDAVGALAVWDGLVALRRRAAGGFIRVLAVSTQGALLGAGLFCAGYLAAHHTTLPEWMCPTEPYLKLVSQSIPEKDALIVSNFGCFLADHFLVGYTHRTYMPLRWQNAPDWLQWHQPPHPEWVFEDLADRHSFDTFGWGRYKRMRENGTVDLYPYDAVHNLEVIDAALHAGRKVYFVSPGIYFDLDAEAGQLLFSRYYVKAIGVGYHDSKLPAVSRALANRFLFSQVVAIADPVGPYRHVIGIWKNTDVFNVSPEGRLLPR